jgi:acyl carrier protein
MGGNNVSVEEKVKVIFKKVLDIGPEEIKPNEKLDLSLGIDSTELVEISVGIKKELGIPLADNELKKSHTFNEIIALLKSKKPGGGCGCGHHHH